MRTANADRGTGAGGGVVVLGVLGKDPMILRADIARQSYSRKRARPDTEECPSDTGDHGVVDRPWTPPVGSKYSMCRLTCGFLGRRWGGGTRGKRLDETQILCLTDGRTPRTDAL
jgi:hypothetical protein